LEDDADALGHNTSPAENLQNEYLGATLENNVVSSCKHQAERINADGASEAYEHVASFKVIETVNSRHRPDLMKTAFSHQDVVLSSPLAVNVQWYTPWQVEGVDVAVGSMHVHVESDPEWVQPARLGPWEALRDKLSRWSCEHALEGHPEVLVLSGEQRALPITPVEDEHCPVLVLADQLLQQGWTMEKHLITHVNPDAHIFDGRNSTRMRWYFRALHHGLARCLPLTAGSMPSQEPMAYYRCLIENIAVSPGRPAKEYQAILNRSRGKRGAEPVPLPPWEEPPPAHRG